MQNWLRMFRQLARFAASRTFWTAGKSKLISTPMIVGCHNYQDANGFLPPARVARDAYATWPVLIAPYIEQENWYKTWDVLAGYAYQPPNGPGEPRVGQPDKLRVRLDVGRGGIGKTKLLHAFSQGFEGRHPAFRLFFLAEGLPVTQDSLDDL